MAINTETPNIKQNYKDRTAIKFRKFEAAKGAELIYSSKMHGDDERKAIERLSHYLHPLQKSPRISKKAPYSICIEDKEMRAIKDMKVLPDHVEIEYLGNREKGSNHEFTKEAINKGVTPEEIFADINDVHKEHKCYRTVEGKYRYSDPKKELSKEAEEITATTDASFRKGDLMPHWHNVVGERGTVIDFAPNEELMELANYDPKNDAIALVYLKNLDDNSINIYGLKKGQSITVPPRYVHGYLFPWGPGAVRVEYDPGLIGKSTREGIDNAAKEKRLRWGDKKFHEVEGKLTTTFNILDNLARSGKSEAKTHLEKIKDTLTKIQSSQREDSPLSREEFNTILLKAGLSDAEANIDPKLLEDTSQTLDYGPFFKKGPRKISELLDLITNSTKSTKAESVRKKLFAQSIKLMFPSKLFAGSYGTLATTVFLTQMQTAMCSACYARIFLTQVYLLLASYITPVTAHHLGATKKITPHLKAFMQKLKQKIEKPDLSQKYYLQIKKYIDPRTGMLDPLKMAKLYKDLK